MACPYEEAAKVLCGMIFFRDFFFLITALRRRLFCQESVQVQPVKEEEAEESKECGDPPKLGTAGKRDIKDSIG